MEAELSARRGRCKTRAIRIGSDNELVSGIGQGTDEIRDQGRDGDDDGGDALNVRGMLVGGSEARRVGCYLSGMPAALA